MSNITQSRASAASRRVESEWWTDDIVGIGVALKDWGGDWYVKVYVKPGPDAYDVLPTEVDGVTVRVIETGPFDLEQ